MFENSTKNTPDGLKPRKILQETSLLREDNTSTLNLIERGISVGTNNPSFARTRKIKIEIFQRIDKSPFRLKDSEFHNPESESKDETTTVSRKKRTSQEASLSTSLDRSTSNLTEVEIPNSKNQICFTHGHQLGIIRRHQKRPFKWKPGKDHIPELEPKGEDIGLGNNGSSIEIKISENVNKATQKRKFLKIKIKDIYIKTGR